MLFKNKALKVTMIDEPKDGTTVTPPPFPSPYRPLIDSVITPGLVKDITQKIVIGYCVMRVTKTVCSAAEHVIVTKVK